MRNRSNKLEKREKKEKKPETLHPGPWAQIKSFKDGLLSPGSLLNSAPIIAHIWYESLHSGLFCFLTCLFFLIKSLSWFQPFSYIKYLVSRYLNFYQSLTWFASSFTELYPCFRILNPYFLVIFLGLLIC